MTDQSIPALPFAGVLFVSMLVLLEVGRRLGARQQVRDAGAPGEHGLASVEGAVFALFGLLLAFTFSGAGSRFDSRRVQIADEANTIGTAYLRLDLLPAESRAPLRALFRDYVSARIDVFRKIPDMAAVKAELARSEKLQHEIWSGAVAATSLPGAHADAAKLVVPALNEMIDITTTRTMAARIHPPRIIYGLLFALALLCAVLAGYGMGGSKHRSWVHILAFVLTIVVAVYVIVDIEYPRQGLFRIDAYDQVLIDLRDAM